MFKIIQISDLHFGKEVPKVLTAGEEIIKELKPDLIIVAGDLTQRSWSWQFFPAAAFLKKLNHPVLIVPGNHDIPLFNIFLRFRKPLKHYDHYFNLPYFSLFENDFLNIIGLNSTNRFHYKNGKLKKPDLEMALEKFKKTHKAKWNILVTHHPFNDIKRNKDTVLSDKFLSSINLWLAGHLHKFKLEKLQYESKKYHGSQCVSGTFISKRLRNEENSFNFLEFDENKTVTITNFYFKTAEGKFIKHSQHHLKR